MDWKASERPPEPEEEADVPQEGANMSIPNMKQAKNGV